MAPVDNNYVTQFGHNNEEVIIPAQVCVRGFLQTFHHDRLAFEHVAVLEFCQVT